MADVDVVDTPQEKVEVEALNGHPGEAAEQSVVQEGGQRRARSPGGRGQCRAQKEGDIQQQHRGVQVHVDAFYGVTLLPGIEVQQDGEQRGHDGDAAAHEGDVLKRRQQLMRTAK